LYVLNPHTNSFWNITQNYWNITQSSDYYWDDYYYWQNYDYYYSNTTQNYDYYYSNTTQSYYIRDYWNATYVPEMPFVSLHVSAPAVNLCMMVIIWICYLCSFQKGVIIAALPLPLYIASLSLSGEGENINCVTMNYNLEDYTICVETGPTHYLTFCIAHIFALVCDLLLVMSLTSSKLYERYKLFQTRKAVIYTQKHSQRQYGTKIMLYNFLTLQLGDAAKIVYKHLRQMEQEPIWSFCHPSGVPVRMISYEPSQNGHNMSEKIISDGGIAICGHWCPLTQFQEENSIDVNLKEQGMVVVGLCKDESHKSPRFIHHPSWE